MAAYGAVATEPPGSLSAGSPVRTRRLVAMVAVCLCVSVALSSRMGSWPSSDARNAQGAQEPQMLWGGSSGASLQVPLAAAPTARQSQLADFEPVKLYTDSPATDFDHGNRIDNYGCMFSDCEGQKTPLLQTVNRLKSLLGKLDSAQQKFIKDLKDKPVKTTMKVTFGAPGRLGARGNRGPVGRVGPIGVTGPKGRTGFIGRPGLPGDEGVRGQKGVDGEEGSRGRQGVQGDRGPAGPRGIKGGEGGKGLNGPRGYAGDNGPAGLDGQKGGPGKPGSAPVGPEGPPGNQGPTGPKGDVGAKGARGPEGNPGEPGAAGIAGIQGITGGFGNDALKLPTPVCLGQKSTRGQSICHGFSSVNWHDYYTSAAYIDVDTSSCKFDNNDVFYFTSLTGNNYVPELAGGSSIYSPTRTGFQVYVKNQIYGGDRVAQGWKLNQQRVRIDWVAVGKSSGPKTTAVCCGTGPSSWGSYYAWGSQLVDAGACQMKGTTAWIGATEGGKAHGSGKFVGTNGFFNEGERFSQWYIQQNTPSNSGRFDGNYLNSGGDQMNPKYCLFGEPFPSGDQALTEGAISQDEYPCDGMRVVGTSKNVLTNTAGICCGKSDNVWVADSKGQLSKTVDTSVCHFKNANVVYFTSLGGDSYHAWTTGSTSYAEHTASNFVFNVFSNDGRSAAFAQQQNWHVNWCGVGDAGTPGV